MKKAIIYVLAMAISLSSLMGCAVTASESTVIENTSVSMSSVKKVSNVSADSPWEINMITFSKIKEDSDYIV